MERRWGDGNRRLRVGEGRYSSMSVVRVHVVVHQQPRLALAPLPGQPGPSLLPLSHHPAAVERSMPGRCRNDSGEGEVGRLQPVSAAGVEPGAQRVAGQ